MNETLIAALDDCLTAMQQGADLEECLGRYPHLAAELRPELQAVQQAQAYVARVQPSPVFVESSRRHFLAQAAKLAAAKSAQAAAMPVSNNGHPKVRVFEPPKPSGWGAFWSWLSAPLAQRSLGALALLLVVVLAGAGMWGVSAQSLPGDPLYGFKRAVEDTRLKLAPNGESRAQLEGEFDQHRLREAQSVTGSGRSVALEFGGILESMNGTQWSVNAIRLSVPAGIEIKGNPQIGLYIHVRGITQTDGSVLAQEIRVEGEKFQGLLEQVRTGSWQIGGRNVWVNANTRFKDNPQPGDWVEARVMLLSDGSALAEEIRLVKQAQDDADRSGPNPTGKPEDDSNGTLEATPAAGGDDHGGRAPDPTGSASGDNSGSTPSETKTPNGSSGKGTSGSSNATLQATRTPEPTRTQQPSRTPAPTRTPGSGGSSGGSSADSGGSSGGSSQPSKTPAPANP